VHRVIDFLRDFGHPEAKANARSSTPLKSHRILRTRTFRELRGMGVLSRSKERRNRFESVIANGDDGNVIRESTICT